MLPLTWPQVLARRLDRHHLSKPAPRGRLISVVGEVCGIHAQVPISADLSIGTRVADVMRVDVHRELWEHRTLVRTYGIRGTVHLFPAGELPMWLAALRANPAQNRRAVLDMLKIEQAQMDAMVGAIGDALDRRMLTRDELGAEIVGRVGRWAGALRFPAFGEMHPVWMPAIGHAAVAGLLCFGPNAGRKVRFVRPDQWLGPGMRRRVGADAALGEVLRRYLAAYGPATLAEFAQWFAATRQTAARAARALVAETVEVRIEGASALALAADVDEAGGAWPSPRRRGSVRLLPSFDVYIVGSHPRDVLIPPAFVEHARRHPASLKWAVAGRAQLAGPIPVLLVDGVVSGMWRRTGTSGRIRIDVEPFVALSSSQMTSLEAEAARVGAILGSEVDVALSVGRVS